VDILAQVNEFNFSSKLTYLGHMDFTRKVLPKMELTMQLYLEILKVPKFGTTIFSSLF